MLDTMREHSRSAVIYVFFAIIIVVFVFSFGPGSGGCRSIGQLSADSPNAATVNGDAIPVTAFQQAYANMYAEYQRRAGGSFNEEMAKTLRLRETVLDGLIDRELVSQAAQKAGLRVSDRELAEKIHSIDAFKVEGKFDQERYLLIVERQLGQSAPQFEEDLRKDMLRQKMLAGVLESVKVSDDEAAAEFTKEKEKLDLAFVRFSPAAFKGEVKPTDAQVEDFLKNNQSKVEQYYKDNSYKFHKPLRVHARHILVKVDESAAQAEQDAAKKKAEDLLAKVKAPGADFAAVAKESSDDPGSKDKGGDLGVFGPGTMDPKFQDAAFHLKAGEISGLVKTRFGYHIIKTEEVLPEEDKKLDEVKKDIASELVADDLAKQEAKKRADETLAALKAGKPLAEQWPAEKKDEKDQGGFKFDMGNTKPEVAETGPFSPSGEYIPKIGMAADVAKDAMALTAEKPAADKVYEVNNTFYVVALKSHEKADLKELEGKKQEYVEKVKARKQNDAVEAFLKTLKDSANIEKNESVLSGKGGSQVVPIEG